MLALVYCSLLSFFFNDATTTEIYTLSLHDALPISRRKMSACSAWMSRQCSTCASVPLGAMAQDRKSTRLNSSHANISYAVFCLKKKNKGLYYVHHTTCRPADHKSQQDVPTHRDALQ